MQTSSLDHRELFFDRAAAAFLSRKLGFCTSAFGLLIFTHILKPQSLYLPYHLSGFTFFAAAYLWVKGRELEPYKANHFFMMIGAVIVTLSFQASFTTGDQLVLHYLQILTVAGGLTFVRWQWLAGFLIMTVGSWLALGSRICPQQMLDTTLSLLIAAVIALGGFAVRRRLFEEQFGLSQSESTRQSELRDALLESARQSEELLSQEAQLADSLTRLEAELLDIYDERTLLEQDLMHSQAMDSLGRLAGGLAHQLNNSLTIISGVLELNQEELSHQPDAEALLSELREAIERGGELAGRLVTVSGSLVVNRRSVRVSQIVRNLKKLIGSHRLARVTFNPRPEDDFNIWVDEGAWLQMLHNLVVNGLDAAGSQGVVVVSVERRDSCAIFSVGDNGPGIPETDRGHIFEPYFTTKERGAGTGLGLAIAAGVAEKHGGELTLAHSDKSGSTFSASVPLAEPSVEPPVAVPSSHKTERDNAARVLLVEDEPAILRVASRHLTKMGFQVTATSKPQEALDMLGRDCFDVVVSDIVMPGMDGPDLIRRARKKTPNLKVIYVSGYTDDRLKGSGLDPQRDPFLKKPYSLPALAKLIDETAALAT